MTQQQYADDLVTESCKVVSLNDDVALNNFVIERDDASIRDSLWHYWAQPFQTDLGDILLHNKSLFSFKEVSVSQQNRTEPLINREETLT